MKRLKTNLPLFFYKLDKLGPDVVFQNGFFPHGTNTNFFDHFLGQSLNRFLEKKKKSAFISVSENIESCVRHLGSMSTTNKNNDEFYLYKIQGTNNMFNVFRTMMYFLGKIQTRDLDFVEYDYILANILYIQYINNFAYQKEWLSLGPIPSERIYSCQKINKISLNHMFDNNLKQFFLPSLNSKEILNMNYDDTYQEIVNFEPLKIDFNADNKIKINFSDSILELDSSYGVLSTLGLAISNNEQYNHNSIFFTNTQMKNSPYGHCYIDLKLVNHPLKNKLSGRYKFSTRKLSKIFLETEDNKSFVLGWQSIATKLTCLLLEEKDQDLGCDFIYDTYSRITIGVTPEKLSFALTIKENDNGINEVIFDLSLINNEFQNFYFEIINIDDYKKQAILRSSLFPNHTLYKKNNDLTNKLYFIDENKSSSEFQKLCINIQDNKTIFDFVKSQKDFTQIIDLGLSWVQNNHKYTINPKTGYSKSSQSGGFNFYYDVLSQKIFYLSDNYEIFCLYNKRYNNSTKWDWVKWVRDDLKESLDSRIKWYFEIVTKESYPSIRRIRSFENKDCLKVMVNNVNKGSLITTNREDNENTISWFYLKDNICL